MAGRNPVKASSATEVLNNIFTGNRVRNLSADARNPQELSTSFRGVDLVLVASSTSDIALEMAQETIKAGIDYMDIQFSQKKDQCVKIN